MVVFRLVILISKFLGPGALSLLRPILPVRKNYDCAIAYRTGFCAEIVAYSVKADKKLCWWHNGEFNYDRKGKAMLGRLLSSFSGIVAVSEGWKNRLSKEFPSISSRINVMYNILDSLQLELSSGELPEEYRGIDYPIVSVGNLTFRKHFDNIVYVVKMLLEDGINNFRWFIIGDGEEYTHIKNLIDHNEVVDHIVMLGKRTNPYPYIRNARLYVHPSYGEAHCTAILEAMALRTPCVVTETFVPQDFTHSGINCIEVARDPQALHAGVLEMMKNPFDAEKMADYAHQQVIRDYSPEVISSSFYSILEQ
jgi:glycosyltransferase involved in cell wall biosynthesis